MIERNETIGRCIVQINGGQFTQACADLTSILDKDPECYQALVARGTCRALAGSTVPTELKKADADFSKAISIMPLLSDVYKRRSQARAALGNLDGAIIDLEECLNQCGSSPYALCVTAVSPSPCVAYDCMALTIGSCNHLSHVYQLSTRVPLWLPQQSSATVAVLSGTSSCCHCVAWANTRRGVQVCL